jgi:hypothetical protein
MTPENFAYWLNGFFELSGVETLNEQQVAIVKEHLSLVFTKVTKSPSNPRNVEDLVKILKENDKEKKQEDFKKQKYTLESDTVSNLRLC